MYISIAIDRSSKLSRAKYVMTIDTGHALKRTSTTNIAKSFLKDNSNHVVQE